MNIHISKVVVNIDNAVENNQYEEALQWLRVLNHYTELVIPLLEIAEPTPL